LKGADGDQINAILAAAGYNMRKLIAAFLYALTEWVDFLENWLSKMSKTSGVTALARRFEFAK
ncbi:MAG: hypothetical protein LLF76_14075, partial [Planctomycetaceae bacterium]|nr:hypothetical protein [Planctomycetaceae bacterium]